MQNPKSFTVIELLVVIAMIGLIASIILVQVQGARERARIASALDFSHTLQNTLGADAVGVWRLEETGDTAFDNSGYGNDGTIYGASHTDGILGSALSFDGTNDYVAIQNLYYDTAGEIPEMTVCAWFKTSYGDTSYSSNWSFIDFDRSEYFNFYIRGDDGRLGFSTTKSGGGIDDFYGNAHLNNGKWHFGCAIYNGTDKILYVDGREDNRKSNPHGGANLGTGTTRYGFIGDGSEASSFNGSRNNIYYEGVIDEVLLYNRALSAAQIQGHYAQEAEKYGKDKI